MRKLFLVLLSFVVLGSVAQTTYFLPITGTNDITEEEYVDKYGQIYNITTPRIDVYLPEENSGVLLLACPGGAYQYVSAENEGANAAAWLNQHGIAVAVLKYRLPNGHENIPLTDAQAALRFIQEHKTEWGIDKIGVIGFSAGGHLAASLLCYPNTMLDARASNNEQHESSIDFGILVYPVVSMEDGVTHAKTKRLLLGENPTEEQIKNWTLPYAVTDSVPRTLIVACQDDKAVPVRNSLDFYQALTNHKVPAELFIFPKGGHGWGFTRTFPQRDLMEEAFLRWIRQE